MQGNYAEKRMAAAGRLVSSPVSPGNCARICPLASEGDRLLRGPFVPLLSGNLAPTKLRGHNPRGARLDSRRLPLQSNKMAALAAVEELELTPSKREAMYAGVTELVENCKPSESKGHHRMLCHDSTIRPR